MIIMTQEFGMDNTVLIGENNNNSSKMTATTTIANNHQDDDEHEEGEILEDGEIADDDDNNNNDDCSMLMVDKTNVNKKINEGSFETNEGNNNNNNQIRNNKINNYNTYGGANHNNSSQHGKNPKFGFFPPPPPPPPSSNGSAKNHSNDNRDDVFGYVSTKMSRRKRRGDRGKKRRFSSSQDHAQGSSPTKRQKFLSPSSSPNANNNSNINNNNNSNNIETTTTSAGQRELINLTQQMNDSSFDSVELSDENEFKFDLIEFDVFMEILGCKIDEDEEIILQKNVPDLDKSKLMCRIVKIMKKLHGNDPDTARRFARLKRRSKEKQNAMNGGGGIGGDEATVVAAKNVYKTPCKFYLEGKCHKGSDCLYSHNMPIPKRKELCKFYLQGFCGKGDDCLFMHEEFPCKFFHTNTKCFAGEGCRFSHKPLTDELREILRSYLDSGTFPDEVKPYRPINHVNDWLKDDDPDSQDFDYEALLSSKTRKVLLGPPTEYMRNQSIETWRWQQGLKESEQSYVGTKKNLFSIDDGLAMLEKPPTPRIEDDDEEIEAHIRNYYNDLLDTDEYDELVHIREIEELEIKVKLEKEQPKLSETIKPAMETTIEQQLPPPILEMSEEEKRLIEASALDEDLRILPQPFTLPPAFQNAGLPSVPQPSLSQPVSVPLPNIQQQQQQLPPPLPIVGVQSTPSQSIVSQTSPFNSFASNLPDQSLSSSMEQQQSSAVVPGFGITSAVPSSSDVSEMQQPAVAAIARDPRIRDPRLNSSNRSMTSNLGNTSSSSSTTTNIGSNIASIANATNKPEIKVIKSNPNLVIKYRLIPADVEPINYSKYHDLYQNEGPLKNDPRLKRFFVNPPPINTNENKNNEPSSGSILGAHWNTNIEQKSEQKIATITSAANTNLIMKPSIETIASPPQSMSTTNQAKPEILGIIGNVVRDPRMRSKDLDQRNNSIDTKNSDSNTSITSTGSTDQNKNDWDVSGKLCFNNNSNCSANKNQDNNDSNQNSSCNSNASFNNMNSMDRDNTNSISNNDGMNLSSIPSYALSAIPPAQSLFSSVSTNLFYGTSGTGGGIENSNINNDSNKINDQEEDDDDDDDESDQLKVDECLIINSNEDEDNNDDTAEDDDIQNLSKRRSPTTTTSTASITATKSSDWADKMKSMDSDNEQEMEIVIQSNQNEDSINNNDSNNNNNNNESESECENDLVIATSSSETEDNNTTTATNNNNSYSSKEYYDSGSNNDGNVDDNQIINDSSNNQNICANNESTITNIN